MELQTVEQGQKRPFSVIGVTLSFTFLEMLYNSLTLSFIVHLRTIYYSKKKKKNIVLTSDMLICKNLLEIK